MQRTGSWNQAGAGTAWQGLPHPVSPCPQPLLGWSGTLSPGHLQPVLGMLVVPPGLGGGCWPRLIPRIQGGNIWGGEHRAGASRMWALGTQPWWQGERRLFQPGSLSCTRKAGGRCSPWLTQPSRRRYGCLERILPAAQDFQEAVDSFQEWLGATERQLAQLWRANGCVSRVQDAHRQTQVGAGLGCGVGSGTRRGRGQPGGQGERGMVRRGEL